MSEPPNYQVGQIVKVNIPYGYGMITEIRESMQFHRNGAPLEKFLYRRGGLVIDHPVGAELEYPFEGKSFGIHVINPNEEILALREELAGLGRKKNLESKRKRLALANSISYLSKYVEK